MKETQPTINVYQEDEIDLRELYKTIARKKLFIAVFTLAITLVATIYGYLKAPVYQGSALIEIGQVVINKENAPMATFFLDDPTTLTTIIDQKFNDQAIKVSIPKGAQNLLELTIDDTNKSKIIARLQQSVEFIEKRHAEKLKLYESNSSKISNTKLIGEIATTQDPVKPKKGLIIAVAFVSGLILSIFIVFLLNFMRDMKE